MRIFVLDASGPDASAEQTFVTQLLRDFSLRDLMSVSARRERVIAVENRQQCAPMLHAVLVGPYRYYMVRKKFNSYSYQYQVHVLVHVLMVSYYSTV